MQISRLLIDEHSPSQHIRLAELLPPHRHLNIGIGAFEAMAIASTINNDPFPRPLTHTLAACLIESLGGKLQHILITDLKPLHGDASQQTFFAELHIQQGDRLIIMDSRPSDAIAIAAALERPIYADELVLSKTNPD